MKRLDRPHQTLLCAALLIAALAATAHAQAGGPYEITKPTIAGGSSTSAGGNYVIIGTMAQHDAVAGGGGPYLFDGGFWPDEMLNSPPAPCAADVTSQVRIKRGSLRFAPGVGRSLQTVQLTNIGAGNIQGPIALVLDGLSENATLFHPSGTTACALPASPYVNVRVGHNGVFRPGERVTLVLQFNNPSHGNITYEARVLAGTHR